MENLLMSDSLASQAQPRRERGGNMEYNRCQVRSKFVPFRVGFRCEIPNMTRPYSIYRIYSIRHTVYSIYICTRILGTGIMCVECVCRGSLDDVGCLACLRCPIR